MNSPEHERPYVRICRGDSCGTDSKHPDFDHDAQVDAISEVAQTRIVGCVDECGLSNVVLVQFGNEKATWLGDLTSDASTDALCTWLAAGGGEPPEAVAERIFDPVQVRKARLSR